MTDEERSINPDDFAISEEMARTLGPRPKDRRRKGDDSNHPTEQKGKGKVVVVPFSLTAS